LGLGIMIKEDVLKYDDQYSILMQVLAMLATLRRHLLFSIMTFRYFYVMWSKPREDKLLHLLMAFLNSFLEKGSQTIVGFKGISSNRFGFNNFVLSWMFDVRPTINHWVQYRDIHYIAMLL